MSRPWLGSKGSWERKPQVPRDKVFSNHEHIFGKKYNWLETKMIKEYLELLLKGKDNA